MSVLSFKDSRHETERAMGMLIQDRDSALENRNNLNVPDGST